jgi:hypothetical protein
MYSQIDPRSVFLEMAAARSSRASSEHAALQQQQAEHAKAAGGLPSILHKKRTALPP